MRYLDKKTILCTLLLSSSVAMADGKAGVTGLLKPIFEGLGDRISGKSDDGNNSINSATGGLLNLGGSQNEKQGVPDLPQGVPGLTADVKGNSGGGSVVNNITYNINNSRNVSLPEGYQQQTGADGRPLPAETKVGADGKPVKVIKALDATGKPVEIEEKTDATGKQVLVEKKKNPQTGQVETKTLPTTPQAPAAAGLLGQAGAAAGIPQIPQLLGKPGKTAPLTGQADAAGFPQIPQLLRKSGTTAALTGQAGVQGQQAGASTLSGLTRERLLEVIANPYNSQNIAAYEQIKALAMQDPEDKSALETLNDHVPPAKAKTIRVSVLEKYIDQILNDQQLAAQNAQQQQLAAQQALLAQQEAERKRQETIRQETDRLMMENKQLVAELEAAGTPKRVIADAFEDARREVTGADVTSIQQQNVAAQTSAQQGVVMQQAASSIPQRPQLPGAPTAQVTAQPQGALQKTTATAGIPQIPPIPSFSAAPAAQVTAQPQGALQKTTATAGIPQIPPIPSFSAAPAAQVTAQPQGALQKTTATAGIPQIPEIPEFGG